MIRVRNPGDFGEEHQENPILPNTHEERYVQPEGVCTLEEIGYKLGTRGDDCEAKMNEDLEQIERDEQRLTE